MWAQKRKMLALQSKKGVDLADIGSERILIISHSYKPLINPRAFRWFSIAEHWAKTGATVDVICSPVAGEDSECTINNVKVYRTGSIFLERLRSLFRSGSRATTSLSTERTPTNKNLLSSFINLLIKFPAKFVHDMFWKKIYWPDYACLWIGPAAKKAIELTSKYHYDVMITVSDPFSSHMVGLKLKEIIQSLHWVVDIGDPFSFRNDAPTNNYGLYKSRNINIERIVLAAADAVSVTCQPTANKYVEVVPEAATR